MMNLNYKLIGILRTHEAPCSIEGNSSPTDLLLLLLLFYISEGFVTLKQIL
jgi:hypothetical protein